MRGPQDFSAVIEAGRKPSPLRLSIPFLRIGAIFSTHINLQQAFALGSVRTVSPMAAIHQSQELLNFRLWKVSEPWQALGAHIQGGFSYNGTHIAQTLAEQNGSAVEYYQEIRDQRSLLCLNKATALLSHASSLDRIT